MLAIYASSFLCAQTNADSNLLPNRSRMIALMEALSQYNSTMLVNTENTLEDEYVPSDLVYLTRIINPNAVTLKSRHIRASRDAAMAISDMANAMCAQGYGNCTYRAPTGRFRHSSICIKGLFPSRMNPTPNTWAQYRPKPVNTGRDLHSTSA